MKPEPTHRVLCRDASGKERTVDVLAGTDQTACTKALKTLNTWRAVRVTPLPKGTAP